MESARIRAVYWPALELLPNDRADPGARLRRSPVINGDLSLGALVAFNAYVVLLIWPLRMLGMIIAPAQRAAASAQRVHEILATEPEVVDPAQPGLAAAARRRGPLRPGARSRYAGAGARARRLRPHDPRRPVGRARRRHRAAASRRSPSSIPRFYDVRRRARAASTASTSASVDPRRAAPRRRPRVRGHVPLLGHHRRPTSRSPTPMRRSSASSGPPAWPVPTSSSMDAARRLRHRDRRAGLLALRRSAPAHRHRPGDPRRPPGPDPRRRHLRRRPDQGARDPRRAHRGHARTAPRSSSPTVRPRSRWPIASC